MRDLEMVMSEAVRGTRFDNDRWRVEDSAFGPQYYVGNLFDNGDCRLIPLSVPFVPVDRRALLARLRSESAALDNSESV